jgi:hypothetical protein
MLAASAVLIAAVITVRWLTRYGETHQAKMRMSWGPWLEVAPGRRGLDAAPPQGEALIATQAFSGFSEQQELS